MIKQLLWLTKTMFLIAENAAALCLMQVVVLHELCHYVMARALKLKINSVTWFRFSTYDDLAHGRVNTESDKEYEALLVYSAPLLIGVLVMSLWEPAYWLFGDPIGSLVFLLPMASILCGIGDYIGICKIIYKMLRRTTVKVPG